MPYQEEENFKSFSKKIFYLLRLTAICCFPKVFSLLRFSCRMKFVKFFLMSFLLLPHLSYAFMMGTSKGPRITILNPYGAENMEKNKIVRIPKGKVYIQSLNKTVDSKKKDPVVQTQSV